MMGAVEGRKASHFPKFIGHVSLSRSPPVMYILSKMFSQVTPITFDPLHIHHT